jgi:hypothetical protein
MMSTCRVFHEGLYTERSSMSSFVVRAKSSAHLARFASENRMSSTCELRQPHNSAILTRKERLTSERSTLTLPRRLERFIWYLSAGDGGAWAAATVLGGGIFHVYFSATPRGCFVSKLIFISAGTINLATYGASAKGVWLRKSNAREVRVALAWLEVGRQLAKEEL